MCGLRKRLAGTPTYNATRNFGPQNYAITTPALTYKPYVHNTSYRTHAQTTALRDLQAGWVYAPGAADRKSSGKKDKG